MLREKSKRLRKKIPKSVKEAVWSRYAGMNRIFAKCYVCRKPIHFTDFEVGHNKAVARGGTNAILNLRPICRSCNNSMKTTSIEAYKRKYFPKSNRKKPSKSKRRKSIHLPRQIVQSTTNSDSQSCILSFSTSKSVKVYIEGIYSVAWILPRPAEQILLVCIVEI